MPWRQNGVGSALLSELISIGRQCHMPRIRLTAPLSSQHFYEDHEFHAASNVYMDAGIPCRDMQLDLLPLGRLIDLKLAY
jgi:predicted GNAT family N-acyltransferase